MTARRPSTAWTFAITSIALFMVALDNLVVTTALPVIKADLGASLADLQWMVNAYTLTFAVLLLTGAALGDRFGRKRIFLIGMAIFTGGSALAALAPSSDILILARAIQGVGGAFVTPLTLTILSAAVPPERRAVALGAWGGIAGLAIAIGPLVGGAIAEGLDWHWIFWLNVPIGLVVMPLAALRLTETYGPEGRLDIPGLGLISAGLLAIVWGVINGNDLGWTSVPVLGAIGAGVALLVGFLAWEARTAQPMLPLGVFRIRAFSSANAVSFLMFFGMFGSVFLLSQFFQVVQGYSPFQAGLRTLPWTGMPVIVAPIAGILAGRIGGRPILATGMAIQAIALAWLAVVVTPTVAYEAMIVPFMLAGVGMGLFFAPIANVVLSAVRPDQEGKASGATNTIREVGGVFGVAVLAAIFSANGDYASPAAYVRRPPAGHRGRSRGRGAGRPRRPVHPGTGRDRRAHRSTERGLRRPARRRTCPCLRRGRGLGRSIERQQALDPPLPRVRAACRRQTGSAVRGPSFVRGLQDLADARRDRRRRRRVDQDADPGLAHDPGHPRQVRRDDRHAGAHRVEEPGRGRQAVVQRRGLERDDRDVRRRGPGRDLVRWCGRQEVDPIGVRKGRRTGLDRRLGPTLPDDDEMDVGQAADRDGGLVDAPVGDDRAQDERDPGRRRQAELAVAAAVRRIRRIGRQRPVVDDRHRPPEGALQVLGERDVHGHHGVGGLGPASLPARQEAAPALGQEGEAGALEVDVARVVDDLAPALRAESERHRQRDQALGLPHVDPLGPDGRIDRRRPRAGANEVPRRLGRATDRVPHSGARAPVSRSFRRRRRSAASPVPGASRVSWAGRPARSDTRREPRSTAGHRRAVRRRSRHSRRRSGSWRASTIGNRP